MVVPHFREWPLTLQTGAIGLVLGLIVWLSLDWYQGRRLEQLLEQELQGRLESELTAARTRLDHYIERYNQLPRLIASHQGLIDHFREHLAKTNNTPEIYRGTPHWNEGLKAWNGLIHPSHYLLIDTTGRVVEASELGSQPLPKQLYQPSPMLLELSLGQTYLTTLDSTPFILTSTPIPDGNRDTMGFLMVISPLDERFLKLSQQGVLKQDSLVVLLDSSKQKVLVSSDQLRLPEGTDIQAVKRSYVVGGKGFFDYGASDLQLQFSLLLPREIVKKLNADILELERRQRLIGAMVLIAAFILLMQFYSQRVSLLSKRVAEFSLHALGMAQPTLRKKDQIRMLEARFSLLTDHVLEARDMMAKSHELESKARQLDVLKAVTCKLGAGVILFDGERYQPVTDEMDAFAEDCGGLEHFLHHWDRGCDLKLIDRYGNQRVFLSASVTLAGENKALLIQDVTELKAKTDALEHQALHDALTSLPNRTLLMDRFRQAIRLAEREKYACSLLMMDLDRFKEVNDTLGHHVGDHLLREVANRLKNRLRDSDTLARMGGDEFAFLLPDTDRDQAVNVINQLQEALEQPFDIEGRHLYIGASIGLALSPENGTDPVLLMQRADIAMYQAKRNHLSYAVYEADIDPFSHERLYLLDGLRNAITEGHLVLHYQPQLDTRGEQPPSLEALVRWRHPQLGLLGPDKFIPLAEETGLIAPLTLWVLENAIMHCADWRKEGFDITVSVNLSASNLRDQTLVGHVNQLLKSHRLEAGNLVLEITESMLMGNSQQTCGVLSSLDAMGVEISIDDFGTGYSSLAYLTQLPVNELKIDRSFIQGMRKNESDAVIVRSTIDLAHNLGLRIVAEGVEEQEEWDQLATLGCDKIQGYLISKPLPVKEMSNWLKQNMHSTKISVTSSG